MLGDLEAALRCTPPADWWRVKLVAAYAAARGGRRSSTPGELHEEAQRELLALGFIDAASLGEGRLHQDLHALLQRASLGEEPASPRSTGGRARPSPK